jgi:hypothetical protein
MVAAYPGTDAFAAWGQARLRSGRPSDWCRIELTVSVWPVRVRGSAGGGVAQPGRLRPACGGEQGAVRAERHPITEPVALRGAQRFGEGLVKLPRRLTLALITQLPCSARHVKDDLIARTGGGVSGSSAAADLLAWVPDGCDRASQITRLCIYLAAAKQPAWSGNLPSHPATGVVSGRRRSGQTYAAGPSALAPGVGAAEDGRRGAFLSAPLTPRQAAGQCRRSDAGTFGRHQR